MLQTVKLTFDGKTKKVHLNANEFSSFTPLLGSFPSIFSLPSDIDLITNSPAHRRKFLNLHLAQSDLLYVHHLARFWRAMKQRNCLLKTKTIDSLDCWEAEMAQSAQYIYQARKTLLSDLQIPLHEQSKRLTSNQECVEIHFEPTYAPLAQEYDLQLKKMRKREKELGATILGPHRDDLRFMIDAKSAHTYASEGQKRTIVTALRLSQWQHLSMKNGAPPFFAIDDFEGTLDLERQKLLNTSLHSMGQVFLTTPRSLRHQFSEDEHLLCVKNGNVVAEKFLAPK